MTTKETVSVSGGIMGQSLITVSHDCEQGLHTFTSKEVPGLFLTGREEDLEELYQAVPALIAELAKADFGLDVVVTPAQSFSSYLETLPASHTPPSARYYSISTLAA